MTISFGNCHFPVAGLDMKRYRVVFMGTPQFAVPSLKALGADERYQVVGVFTQPDRPAGRGKRLTACPVKQTADAMGLSVFQYQRIRNPEGVAQLRELAPDVVVTAAFGQILSQELLDIPVHGTVNVHASLLPGYRGPAPINWCIIRGEKETGVTIMRTDAGIDTGDVIDSERTDIGEMETAGELSQRLSHIGASLLLRVLPDYLEGNRVPQPQPIEGASYQPMLDKAMGRIDWAHSADAIAHLVRGLNPWPCAYTAIPAGRLKIYLARAIPSDSDSVPGTVITSSAREGLRMRCGDGALEVLEMQAPGGKQMAAKAFLAGKPIEVGRISGKACIE